MYTHGSGIRARWKRWFLAVAGSRTGHPLQGEVSGGMTLVAFTCRGRPAAMSRATLRRYGSRWDGSSLRGTFRQAVLRRPAPGVPRPQLMQTPSPRSGSPCISSKSAAPAMARGRRDSRVIDPFRAVAAAAPLIQWRALGYHNLFSILRFVPNTTSSTFGLIVQDQIPRACILAVWRIHSPFLQICRGPFCSAWGLGRLHARQYPHLPVVPTSACSWGSGSRRRPPVLGNRRGPHRHPACRGGGVRGRQGRHHR